MLLTLLSPQIAPGSIVGSVNVTEAPDTLDGLGQVTVSYTHLTLPTNREV